MCRRNTAWPRVQCRCDIQVGTAHTPDWRHLGRSRPDMKNPARMCLQKGTCHLCMICSSRWRHLCTSDTGSHMAGTPGSLHRRTCRQDTRECRWSRTRRLGQGMRCTPRRWLQCRSNKMYHTAGTAGLHSHCTCRGGSSPSTCH